MDWAKARRGGRRRGNHCTSCVICRWPRWHPPCGATHTKLEAMVSSCKWLMRWPPIERLERGEGTGAQVLQTNSLFTTPYRVGHRGSLEGRTRRHDMVNAVQQLDPFVSDARGVRRGSSCRCCC